jgi:hypothetical protein
MRQGTQGRSLPALDSSKPKAPVKESLSASIIQTLKKTAAQDTDPGCSECGRPIFAIWGWDLSFV